MKFILLTFIFFFISNGCSKPKATVFKDERLLQQEDVKFCFTGDMGKETNHQREIAEALGREDCDRIFMLGDLVYPKGIEGIDDPQLETKFLSYYQPLLDKDPGLIIPLVLGNHDHKGKPEAWLDVRKSNPGFFFPHYYYFIDYGGLCIVGLETSFYYYTSKVAEASEQTTWLTKLQPRLKDCKVKVALTHHPLKGTVPGLNDWEGASGELKLFLETYIIGKFDIHISGHVHALLDDGKDEGTRLLISGTGGEVTGGGKSGFLILSWEPQNPKRIGYNFRFVDTEVNVVEDPLDETRQSEMAVEEPEAIIPKNRVTETFLSKVYDSIIHYLNKFK